MFSHGSLNETHGFNAFQLHIKVKYLARSQQSTNPVLPRTADKSWNKRKKQARIIGEPMKLFNYLYQTDDIYPPLLPSNHDNEKISTAYW